MDLFSQSVAAPDTDTETQDEPGAPYGEELPITDGTPESNRDNTTDQDVPYPNRFPGDGKHAFVLAQSDARMQYNPEDAPSDLEETQDRWFDMRNVREV